MSYMLSLLSQGRGAHSEKKREGGREGLQYTTFTVEDRDTVEQTQEKGREKKPARPTRGHRLSQVYISLSLSFYPHVRKSPLSLSPLHSTGITLASTPRVYILPSFAYSPCHCVPFVSLSLSPSAHEAIVLLSSR